MRILILLLFLCSCSSMKRTILYSSLAGGMAGATAGALLSPDKESTGFNTAIFGLTGAAVAALAGYMMYEDDPRNKKLKNMLMADGEKKKPGMVEIGLGDLKIEAQMDKKEAYKVPLKELPMELKGKVKKQYLIKYESKERYINSGSKTFYIPEFEIYEHSYDEKIGGEHDK
ncbi:MAG: hypothetical protein KAQ98_14570 [Bacteriovoracaceae bacterium]|nr:hypothetical protein [Bacteriovoracaceae bacterium]